MQLSIETEDIRTTPKSSFFSVQIHGLAHIERSPVHKRRTIAAWLVLRYLISVWVVVTIAIYSNHSVSSQTIKSSRTRSKSQGTQATTKKWFTFRGPDSEFTLLFPGKPRAEDSVPSPFSDIRGYRFTTPGGMTFALNLLDIGGDPNAAHNNRWNEELERLLSEADRKQGLRVVQMRRLAKNTTEFELWQEIPETNSHINYLRRSIIRRSRVYTLSCGWLIDRKRVDRLTCHQFFDSLRFTRASYGRRVGRSKTAAVRRPAREKKRFLTTPPFGWGDKNVRFDPFRLKRKKPSEVLFRKVL